MNMIPIIRRTTSFASRFLCVALCATSITLGRAAEPIGQSPVLWDTGPSSGSEVDLKARDGWRMVPSDLMVLEADPAKARSDPGYYGREFSFKGDAVVENQKLIAVFLSTKGRVVLYSKGGSSPLSRTSSNSGASATKVLELTAPQAQSERTQPGRIEVVRNADDEVVLRFWFQGTPDTSAVLAFGKTEVVDVKPSPEMKMARLRGAFEYGIVPTFIGDDLIFGSEKAGSNSTLCLPSESMLLGLLKGEASELVMTWPKGKQQVRLGLSQAQGDTRSIEFIDFDNAGQSFYLAVLSTPGIWHREKLDATFLEQDVPIGWKRPFPAKWKTQLYEEKLKTTFGFRSCQGEIWRGVPGSYNYPVWFDGDQAIYRLSKKVQPKGESVIYCVEGQGTPSSVLTPVDVLKTTLGRAAADSILDVEGRKLRTHHRRGGDGVHRACTCGCTEAIQAVFEAGEEVARKDDIKGDLEDMMYFVHRHVDRINEYQHFANGLIKELEKTSIPELDEYIGKLEEILKQIPEEYGVQKENMKSFEYADDLLKRTLALTEKHDPNNVKAYMDLLKEWRGMGGAQDYVLARCHIIVRNFAQEAGYGCAGKPQAVALAQELRARARECLRNPDGYEIWADY